MQDSGSIYEFPCKKKEGMVERNLTRLLIKSTEKVSVLLSWNSLDLIHHVVLLGECLFFLLSNLFLDITVSAWANERIASNDLQL